jgi:mannitol/fructose-specific phosphotransferase system IIA component (Ntr-type)
MIDSRRVELAIPRVGNVATLAVFVPDGAVESLAADARLLAICRDAWLDTWRRHREFLAKHPGEDAWTPKCPFPVDDQSSEDIPWMESHLREWLLILAYAVDLMAEGRDDVTRRHYAALLGHEVFGARCTLGYGYAIPHFRSPDVTEHRWAVVVSEKGYDYDSIDGEPVYVAFLEACADRHPRPLSAAASWMRDDTFRRFLRRSRCVNDICDLLDEAVNGQFS